MRSDQTNIITIKIHSTVYKYVLKTVHSTNYVLVAKNIIKIATCTNRVLVHIETLSCFLPLRKAVAGTNVAMTSNHFGVLVYSWDTICKGHQNLRGPSSEAFLLSYPA